MVAKRKFQGTGETGKPQRLQRICRGNAGHLTETASLNDGQEENPNTGRTGQKHGNAPKYALTTPCRGVFFKPRQEETEAKRPTGQKTACAVPQSCYKWTQRKTGLCFTEKLLYFGTTLFRADFRFKRLLSLAWSCMPGT